MLLQERLLKETMETPNLPRTNLSFDTPNKSDVFGKTTVLPESSKQVKPDIPLSSEKLSTPSFFAKKQMVEETVKAENPKIEPKQTAKVEKKGIMSNIAESLSAGELKSIGAVKKVGESSHAQSPRPSNPFAKSSNNQDKSSLLDSLKKMRNDNTNKR